MTYPSNSDMSKNQTSTRPEHIKSVVNTAPEKKVSKIEKLLPKSVLNFVKPKNPELLKQQLERSVKLVIIDTIQSALLGNDAKTAGQNMFSTFFNSMSNQWGGGASYNNYGSMYNNQTRTYNGGNVNQTMNQPQYDSSVYRYKDLVYKSKIDADAVLRGMNEWILQYGVVSCFELYELSGVPTIAIDRNFGWRDISTASIGLSGGGWVISLPKALPLE